jgi:hypothetical protein
MGPTGILPVVRQGTESAEKRKRLFRSALASTHTPAPAHVRARGIPYDERCRERINCALRGTSISQGTAYARVGSEHAEDKDLQLRTHTDGIGHRPCGSGGDKAFDTKKHESSANKDCATEWPNETLQPRAQTASLLL